MFLHDFLFWSLTALTGIYLMACWTMLVKVSEKRRVLAKVRHRSRRYSHSPIRDQLNI
jgi:heme exporter protein D